MINICLISSETEEIFLILFLGTFFGHVVFQKIIVSIL
jgi:hypothetical protein